PTGRGGPPGALPTAPPPPPAPAAPRGAPPPPARLPGARVAEVGARLAA
ncbi:hypothetical protein I5K76_26100, partial [Pseudomonas aeruginosa]|nr:hypothetical protein [Pseudomonas aeruginosa]